MGSMKMSRSDEGNYVDNSELMGRFTNDGTEPVFWRVIIYERGGTRNWVRGQQAPQASGFGQYLGPSSRPENKFCRSGLGTLRISLPGARNRWCLSARTS